MNKPLHRRNKIPIIPIRNIRVSISVNQLQNRISKQEKLKISQRGLSTTKFHKYSKILLKFHFPRLDVPYPFSIPIPSSRHTCAIYTRIFLLFFSKLQATKAYILDRGREDRVVEIDREELRSTVKR